MGQLIININNQINKIVWGYPMIGLMIFTGLFLTLNNRFFQFRYIKLITQETFLKLFSKRERTDNKSISQFQAMSTALAATIGTGNIAGVASAVAIGGPGSIFWMWVSAILGMMTAFSENVLGIYYRIKGGKGEWNGGAMYYLEKCSSNKTFGKMLAVLFSFFCIIASFGMGNMVQINTIASVIKSNFGVSPAILGAVISAIVGIIIIGGINRIGKIAEIFVPFMALFYIAASLLICIINYREIPSCIGKIFTYAFDFKAVMGGISGISLKKAVEMGFKRGVFSNEAGLGSAVSVHASADVKEPVEIGMWGIFEVFVDTIVVCSLTAFVILFTKTNNIPLEGASLVTLAFSNAFGKWAGKILSMAIFLFGFATIIGWSFFGQKAWEYLFGTKSVFLYRVIYVFCVFIGAVAELTLIWSISDTFNALMAIPNLIGVLLLNKKVKIITNNYINRKIKNKNEKPIYSYFE
ncbi:MAG: sodium:alanine symporter family protein [Clostridia bacterium]|nr:sodium:alanine symporter family protein [Clostridia bacterium]